MIGPGVAIPSDWPEAGLAHVLPHTLAHQHERRPVGWWFAAGAEVEHGGPEGSGPTKPRLGRECRKRPRGELDCGLRVEGPLRHKQRTGTGLATGVGKPR